MQDAWQPEARWSTYIWQTCVKSTRHARASWSADFVRKAQPLQLYPFVAVVGVAQHHGRSAAAW